MRKLMHQLLADIPSLIARLDGRSFTILAQTLLAQEARSIGVSGADIVFSTSMDVGDAGLDGLIRGAASNTDLLPEGTTGFQFKAKKTTTAAGLDVAGEIRKPGPTRILRDGGTYVLLSSQQMNPRQREELELAVQADATAVVGALGDTTTPKTAVWDAGVLARLVWKYPAIATDFGLADYDHALSINEVKSALRVGDRPYERDGHREVAIARIRERTTAARTDPLIMSVRGDPGVGKTRTVIEALDTEDVRDSVVVVRGSEGLRTLLTRFIRYESSEGILVADEVTDAEMTDAVRQIGGLLGRWRIVAIGTPSDNLWMPDRGANLLLPPLDREATRRLVEKSTGLPEDLARMVAEVAAGFPELAFTLAAELQRDPNLDLVGLARMPSPNAILERALPDAVLRSCLEPIALFTGVGFEGELRYEMDELARAFGLDADLLEHQCRAEADRGRFVSRMGRYVAVTPRLVAIWLATQLIERTPRFEDRILALPQSLQDAFVRQLAYFGPTAPHLPAALARVLESDRFRDPDAFDEAAGTILRAAAAIIPEQVAGSILAITERASDKQLLEIPRRDLVTALQVLLWWPETWESAVKSLYQLATHENEGWANNARGTFAHAFTVILSGSTVPYDIRSRWLMRTIEEGVNPDWPVLIDAAQAGLETHHTRMVTGFPGGGEPIDWQPATMEEFEAAQRTALDLLLRIYDRADAAGRASAVDAIAAGLRVVEHAGEVEAVLSLLTAREWSRSDATKLATAVRRLISYSELQPADRAALEAAHDALVGTSLDGRLTVLLSTPYWDLPMDRDRSTPPRLIQDLATDVVELGPTKAISLAIESRSVGADAQTRFFFLKEVARQTSHRELGEQAVAEADWDAAIASVAVADEADDPDWATGLVRRVSELAPEEAPRLAIAGSTNLDRIEIALGCVDAGVPAIDLGRLMYGAQARTMPGGLVARIARALQREDVLEPALAIIVDWLESNHAGAADVVAAASGLSLEAAQSGSPMTEFYLQQIVQSGLLPQEVLLDLWERRVAEHPGLVDELDGLLTDRLLDAPEIAKAAFLAFAKQPTGFSLVQGQDLAILSRLAERTSPAEIWAELAAWDDLELRWALHGMRWTGTVPDPLVKQFLESDRLPELTDEAGVCFRNSLGVVMGPYSKALEGEAVRARAWATSFAEGPARQWATDLAAHIELEVAWHRQQEAERAITYQ